MRSHVVGGTAKERRLTFPSLQSSESLPASAAQARYVRGATDGGWCNVNLGLGIDLPTNVTLAHVDHAINLLVGRHESLRTTFAWRGENIRRMVTPANHVGACAVKRVTGTGFVEDSATALLNEPFKLGGAPAFRCAVLENASVRRLVIIFHHSMVDAVSCRLLADELAGIMNGSGSASTRRHREAGQYREFVEREIALETDSRKEFWARALGRPHDLPPILQDRQVVADGPLVVAPAPLTVSRGDVRKLRARALLLGYGVGVTLAAIAVRAFADGELRNLRLGFAFANRRGARSRDMIGLVADILPMRINCSTGSTIDELALRVHQELRRNLQQQMSLSAIMRSVGASVRPPFDIHVNFLPAYMSGAERTSRPLSIARVVDLKAERRRIVTTSLAIAPLRIKFVERGDGQMLVIVESVGATFGYSTLLAFASHLVESVIAAVRDLKAPTLQVSL
jgi:hypothetical protein